jgi:imidazolonepropionase-like amidohydrolase
MASLRTIIALALAIAVLSVFGQAPVNSNNRPIAIKNVNVVTMVDEKILEGQTVVIEDGKIAAMGRNVKLKANTLEIDGRGKWLMPGLAEMHAHVPPVDDLNPMKDVLMLFAANGITTIRGMLGHPRHLELRTMLQKGEIIGPRFFTTGPSFNGMSVTSPAAGAEMVKRQKNQGYDFLKLHPGLSRQKFDSIATTAKQIGIPFAGHVSFGVGVWHAIESGYSSIDHLDGFIEGLVPGIERKTEQDAGLFGMFVSQDADTSRIPELMMALKRNNVWVVPTQALAERWFSPDFDADDFKNDPQSRYMKPEVVDQWIISKKNLVSNPQYDPERIRRFIELRRKLIKACQDNGVGLLLGCDAPQVFNVPGISTHQELVYLVKSGLTPFQAIRTGTVNVATYLDLPEVGVIRPGAVADVVLVGGNPLANIEATQDIEGVMLNGTWLSKEYLAGELAKLIR